MPHLSDRRHAAPWAVLALTLLLAQACTPQPTESGRETATFRATTGGY